ncbi:unnamed protein product [Nezara viridula]|uniref:NodB homology domain-containing protein n=1 Tax=Nezara viridula TaxID=85310 RepID=A0A9P0HE16_NEZVI|nr:unnamed protein product [Nezara viridula]
MYSHELQTCDWPRNVGCAPGQQQALQQQEIGQNSRQQLRQDARQQELRQELARHELRQQEARHDLRQQDARQELRQQEARQELRQQEARQELRQQEARQELRQQEAREDLRQQELRQDPRHELRPEYRQVQEALRQPKQQQQILQQVVDNRGRQRAQITVPKADLYNTEEEELGPAIEELEIDRQQRVYRGQPSTLGQVASDRDGLTHSNAIPVPATGGRDKLSVISYGAQQQYNRASVQPVQQPYDSRGYNTTRYIQQQQQQYTDPNYYSVYDEEAEQYKDIADYAQYIQQNKQDIYTRKKPSVEIVQQEPVQRGATFQKNKYSTQPENIYQSVTPQEYDSYSIQNNDDLYRQVQTKPSTRNNQRHRGSQTYTVSPNEAEPAPSPVATSPPRGTLPPNRGRPTLKPSNSVVSKAAEFVDIYRFPPSRPENVYPTPQVDKTAAKCRKDVCLLPDCYCGGKDVPGELTPEETPQIVLLTFDDSVNDLNKGLYSDLFDKGRVNPNGCPISATFYVSHEWTDYSQVQNLYAGGHEIASHSVSHSFGEQFSQKKWTREIAGQREILAAYGGVKLEDIRGMRAPFLAVGGNKMFKMLYDSNFTYDSSMPVYENRPPSWPYTLDYKVFHDCMIPPCPTKSYPGIWEVPMVMWQDLNGGRCSMGDACSNPPTSDGVYKMLLKNFERHFTTNRAPFGLFYHAAWFTQPHHKEGFISFLDTINKMPEVWLITNWQAIQWVRDPTPISRLGSFAPFQCNYHDRPKKCNNPKVCNLWHKSGVRYMRTCQACPEIYPWTGKSGVRNSRVDNDLE